MHEFVDEFFANFVHEFKYEIRTNSYEVFATKIGYVTNSLYCKKVVHCWGMKVSEDFQMGYENLKQKLDGLQVFWRKNYISFHPGPGY